MSRGISLPGATILGEDERFSPDAPLIRLEPSRLLQWASVPFFLLLASHILAYFYIGNAYEANTNPTGAMAVTALRAMILFLCVTLTMVVSMTEGLRTSTWAYLAAMALVFAHAFWISFDQNAATYALGKFLVPIAALLFGYAFRHDVSTLVHAFLFVVIVNDAFQVVLTTCYIMEWQIPGLWFTTEGHLLRASGFCDTAAFAFINFAAAVVSYHLLKSKRLLIVFLIFSLHAVTFKTYIVIGSYLLFRLRDRGLGALVLLAGVCLPMILLFVGGENVHDDISRGVSKRVRFYITRQESARNESYRVMFESLAAGNLFGEGLGYFGGPASVQYKSPAYERYGFKWWGMEGMRTTDTYYPHVFVELGLIGGLVFLMHLVLPLFDWRGSREAWTVYSWLLIAMLWEGVTSFCLQNFSYIFACTVLLFGLAELRSSSQDVGENPEIIRATSRPRATDHEQKRRGLRPTRGRDAASAPHPSVSE